MGNTQHELIHTSLQTSSSRSANGKSHRTTVTGNRVAIECIRSPYRTQGLVDSFWYAKGTNEYPVGGPGELEKGHTSSHTCNKAQLESKHVGNNLEVWTLPVPH